MLIAEKKDAEKEAEEIVKQLELTNDQHAEIMQRNEIAAKNQVKDGERRLKVSNIFTLK